MKGVLRITAAALVTVVCVLLSQVGAQSEGGAPSLTSADRLRLAEAFRLFDSMHDAVWHEWSRAPFAVLLVTTENEFLLRHEKPTDDFKPLGDDPVLKTPVCVRPRKYDVSLLATFPAVGAVPTVVIGQAENTTAKTPTAWVVTLLHEHFHQWQYSQPGYYAAAEALGLTGGDQTGMWMLNYPFPYTDGDVAAKFDALSRSLAAVLELQGKPKFNERYSVYVRERSAFKDSLKQNDYKYLAFQEWQEGIARYTEYKVARWAEEHYQATEEFKRLADYSSFNSLADKILDGIRSKLTAPQLAKDQRTAFYAFGAAEGLLLDAVRPGWHESYMKEQFSLDAHFASVAK